MQYQDPETGEVFDYEPEPDSSYRNAGGVRDHRPGGGGGGRPYQQQNLPSRPNAGAPPPRAQSHGHQSGGVIRHPTHSRPVHSRPRATHPAAAYDGNGDYMTIRKSAIIELLPIAGQLWASFLGRPDVPQAVGNDVIDRDNASMHRDALAMHQQNQTRILSLSDLASRVVKIFV